MTYGISSSLVLGAEPAMALTWAAVRSTRVILQGPLCPKEEVVIGVVFLNQVVALAHGQPGVLDPSSVPVSLSVSSLTAGGAEICIVRYPALEDGPHTADLTFPMPMLTPWCRF